jgi:hypothetical protein
MHKETAVRTESKMFGYFPGRTDCENEIEARRIKLRWGVATIRRRDADPDGVFGRKFAKFVTETLWTGLKNLTKNGMSFLHPVNVAFLVLEALYWVPLAAFMALIAVPFVSLGLSVAAVLIGQIL